MIVSFLFVVILWAKFDSDWEEHKNENLWSDVTIIYNVEQLFWEYT